MTTETFVTTEIVLYTNPMPVACEHAPHRGRRVTKPPLRDLDPPPPEEQPRASCDTEHYDPPSELPSEGECKVTLTLRSITFDALQFKAAREGCSVSRLADETLHRYLGDIIDSAPREIAP